MRRVDPAELRGPRAYFTAFDPKIVERSVADLELRRRCERKLKLLLLLKARVVCAASHLSSPIAYGIFRENPVLLDQKLVTPALRSTRATISDALTESTDAARFYDGAVSEVVTWDLEDNSAWFRQRFVEELRNPGSVVRLNAMHVDDGAVERFVSGLDGTPLLDRERIERWAAELPPQDRQVVLAFRELVYHVSGARVVRCEGSLPQEEYLDFDLADLSQQRTRLSDGMVFWKIFVEQALAALHLRTVPVEVLDVLDFDDIAALRAPLLESGFQTKYDELTRTVVQDFGGTPNSLVHGMEQLEAIRSALHETFSVIFDKELPRFLRKKSVSMTGGAMSNVSSLALGLAGFVPGLGTVLSGAGVVKDLTALTFNVVDLSASPRALVRLVLARERAVRQIASRLPMNATNLDVVEALTAMINKRLEVVPR